MDNTTPPDLPAPVAIVQPLPPAGDTLQALASAFLLQLETDLTCPLFVKKIFSDLDDVLYHLHDAQVGFLPGLLDLLVTGTPPSVQNFVGTSLPLEKGYGLYVLVLTKWVDNKFTVKCSWDYRLYLGSGTAKVHGIVSRFHDYDREERYAMNVADAIHFGWTISHRCIIAWAPQVEAVRHFQLRVLFLSLEATLSHVFAFHDHDQMKSMEKSFWNPAILDYQGLCMGSSLREIYTFRDLIELTEEELREELEVVQKRAKIQRKKYLEQPRVKEMRAAWQRERRKDPEVKERQLMQGKVYDAKRRNNPEFKVKKAASDKAYAQTSAGKASQAARTKRYREKRKAMREAMQ